MKSMESGFNISGPALSSGQFDIRDDEEQSEKLSEILNLLFSAGYYRANIHGLSNFDKVVGGMVWCVSHCSQQVDVDLLYSENSTIGQKIALTERIIKVLPLLKCPFALEPHQINLNLDSVHILPVVQWLVNEAVEVKQRRGDETQNFAIYQFGQESWRVKDDPDVGVLPMVKRGRKVYKRVIRMNKAPTSYINSKQPITNGNHDISETFVSSLVHNVEESSEADLIVFHCDIDGVGGAYTIVGEDQKELSINIDINEKVKIAGKSEESLSEELEELSREEASLLSELTKEKQLQIELENNTFELEKQIETFSETIEQTDPAVFDQLKQLLLQRDEIKSTESNFKKKCRDLLNQLDNQIEVLRRRREDGQIGEDGKKLEHLKKLEEFEALNKHIQNLNEQLRGLNREIIVMERRVESKPTQVELQQFQRRFIELYNQMSSKHRETKRQYTQYNTLVDVRAFIRKEIDLLNSIDDSRELAQREEYKDSFIENLQKINRGVDESLDKILCRKRSLQEQKDALTDQLQMLLDKQRLYSKTVVEFQQECQRNEELQAKLS